MIHLVLLILIGFHVDVTQECNAAYVCTGASRTYPSFTVQCVGVEQTCWTRATPIVAKQVGTRSRPHFTPYKWRPLVGNAKAGKATEYNLTQEWEAVSFNTPRQTVNVQP